MKQVAEKLVGRDDKKVQVYEKVWDSQIALLSKTRAFCETLCEPKWPKAKKQLLVLYMKKFLSVLDPKKITCPGFSDTLGQMHDINGDKAQVLPDTAWSSGHLMPRR